MVKSQLNKKKQFVLKKILKKLYTLGINNLLVEAGPTLSGYLLERKLVDEIVIYQAPHIMGSETTNFAITPSWKALLDREEITITDIRRFGMDTRITASFNRSK